MSAGVTPGRGATWQLNLQVRPARRNLDRNGLPQQQEQGFEDKSCTPMIILLIQQTPTGETQYKGTRSLGHDFLLFTIYIQND